MSTNSGELRWPVSLATILVITLQLLLPDRLSLNFQDFILIIEILLVLFIIISNPNRIAQHKSHLWYSGIALNLVMTISNIAGVIKLIDLLVNGKISDPAQLLFSGGSIWISNMVIFSLWYWEIDGGGSGFRSQSEKYNPDFLFTQMSNPGFAKPNWKPVYLDYFYLSLTNSSAFSPTDVLPLSRIAKSLMSIQSLISMLTLLLIVARAVNILN
ncbi:MAG: hypothetical protein NTV47_03545 [Actinobacteria bacterium]|nr:hypothetical protein [Actinomycetota bacterium]